MGSRKSEENRRPLLNGGNNEEPEHTSLEVNDLVAPGNSNFRDPADNEEVPETRSALSVN